MQTSAGWPEPLDLIGLLLVALLLFLGLYRGLWWQMIRLAGVALAVLVARAVGGPLAERLQALFPGFEPRTAHGVAWGALFLITLFGCALLGLAGQRLIEALRLDLANRLAGACAGAITGLCVHVALVVLVCHLAPERVLGRYVAGTYSERLYGALGLRWPVVMAADAAREVDQVLERSPHHVHPRGTVR
jgi:uncharacterized membrane protein required for colicin V production